MWNDILCVSSAVLSCCFLILTVLFARRARRDSGPAAAQLRLCISRIQSLTESQDELRLELERLANRVKMQRVRNVTEHGQRLTGEFPDPHSDPEGWRKAMNRKLAMNRIGVKQ